MATFCHLALHIPLERYKPYVQKHCLHSTQLYISMKRPVQSNSLFCSFIEIERKKMDTDFHTLQKTTLVRSQIFLAQASQWFTQNNSCDPTHLHFFNLRTLNIGFCLSDTQALSRTAPFASKSNAELFLSNTTVSTLKPIHSQVCTPSTSGVFSVKIQV